MACLVLFCRGWYLAYYFGSLVDATFSPVTLAPPAIVSLDLGVPDRVFGRCVRFCLLGGSAAAPRGRSGLGNERFSYGCRCCYRRDDVPLRDDWRAVCIVLWSFVFNSGDANLFRFSTIRSSALRNFHFCARGSTKQKGTEQ